MTTINISGLSKPTVLVALYKNAVNSQVMKNILVKLIAKDEYMLHHDSEIFCRKFLKGYKV